MACRSLLRPNSGRLCCQSPVRGYSVSSSLREGKSQSPGQNTKYPLYPAVAVLIHQKGLSESEISKITATGPNGRLLKGDVLSYLGQIKADYSSSQSKRIEQLGHLDLSNIKIAPRKDAPPAQAQAPPPEAPRERTVSLPISFTEVLKVQKRVEETLGVTMPLSTFLARAVDLANGNLPRSKDSTPSSDELFNAVLGLDTISTGSSGSYIPQITALPTSVQQSSSSRSLGLRRKNQKAPDIIDILSGSTTRAGPRANPSSRISDNALLGPANLFSVTVPIAEEKRARTFLERVKTVLQVEPGRLVL